MGRRIAGHLRLAGLQLHPPAAPALPDGGHQLADGLRGQGLHLRGGGALASCVMVARSLRRPGFSGEQIYTGKIPQEKSWLLASARSRLFVGVRHIEGAAPPV